MKPAHLDMDRMAKLGMSNRRAFLDDLAHARVASNRPLDFDGPFGDAATLLVQSTKPSGAGSPDATPGANG